MMNIDEQWRKEFEQLRLEEVLNTLKPMADGTFFIRINPDTGEYFDRYSELKWRGFLMAKRAQKPVELPKPEMCFASGVNGHRSFAYVRLDPLTAALEAAGVPFTIKGDPQ